MIGRDDSVKNEFDLEQHLKYLVDKYCKDLSQLQIETMQKRICDEKGNNLYRPTPQNSDCQYEISSQGSKVYDLDDLRSFPDLEKDFPPTIAYPTNSAEYQSGISQINKLINTGFFRQ